MGLHCSDWADADTKTQPSPPMSELNYRCSWGDNCDLCEYCGYRFAAFRASAEPFHPLIDIILHGFTRSVSEQINHLSTRVTQDIINSQVVMKQALVDTNRLTHRINDSQVVIKQALADTNRETGLSSSRHLNAGLIIAAFHLSTIINSPHFTWWQLAGVIILLCWAIHSIWGSISKECARVALFRPIHIRSSLCVWVNIGSIRSSLFSPKTWKHIFWGGSAFIFLALMGYMLQVTYNNPVGQMNIQPEVCISVIEGIYADSFY